MKLLRLLLIIWSLVLALGPIAVPVAAADSAAQAAKIFPAENREEGRHRMAMLVEQFSNDPNAWELLEAKTREIYLDEFMRTLGWDVDNAREVELYRQDTIPESRLYMVRNTRYIDYKHRAGDEVFILEAKRVREDVDKSDYRYQTKRYAWSSMRSELGILSNFRQFRVFDCRVKPDWHRPDEGEIVSLRMDFSDYVARFDTLWDTFSYEAVRNGSLGKLLQEYDDTLTRRTIDIELVAHMDALRVLLAADILRNNPSISERELNSATHNILNRILFCRVLEDRDIEPSGLLRNVVMAWRGDAALNDGRQSFNGTAGSLFGNVIKTFNQRMYDRYQGTIFRPHNSDNLVISDAVMERVIMELYPANERNGQGAPYDFRAVPIEVIGNIYQSYLGNRIVIVPENERKTDIPTVQRAAGNIYPLEDCVRLEESPSVREAGGIFYTPDNIARFLTEQTLRPVVTGKRPQELSGLRIIDPASGCGALLAQTTIYLFEQARTWFSLNPDKIGGLNTEFPDAIIRDDGSVKLSPHLKAQLVQNCIYGIDIDRQATEIATLWLYILILENENSSVVDWERRQKHDNRSWKEDSSFKLPDLSRNLIAANSLIEPDYTGSDRREAQPFDWYENDSKIAQIMKDGGFDIVVGNPPYIGYNKMLVHMPEQLPYLKRKYQSMAKYQVDLAYAFIERGSQLMNSNGRLGYIVTNRFLYNKGATELRKYLASRNVLKEIYDFGGTYIFDSAKAFSAILILENNYHGKLRYSELMNSSGLSDMLNVHTSDVETSEFYSVSVDNDNLKDGVWKFFAPSKNKTLEYIEGHTATLSDYAHVFSGVDTANRALFEVQIISIEGDTAMVKLKSDEALFKIEKAILRPLADGRGIILYAPMCSDSYVICPYDNENNLIPENILQTQYPYAYNYFTLHREDLEKRTSCQTWYSWRRFTQSNEQKLPKLYVGMGVKAGIDVNGDLIFYQGNSSVIVAKSNAINNWMIMGILNSQLCKNYLSSFVARMGDSLMCNPIAMKSIPIPEYNEETAPLYQQIGNITKRIFDLKAADIQADTAQLENELESLVKELYKIKPSESRQAAYISPAEYRQMILEFAYS